MTLLPNIIFGLILLSGIGFFVKNINKLRRNIKLGKSINIEEGSSKQRWANMARIALGPLVNYYGRIAFQMSLG